jgi:hypothetical protein
METRLIIAYSLIALLLLPGLLWVAIRRIRKARYQRLGRAERSSRPAFKRGDA